MNDDFEETIEITPKSEFTVLEQILFSRGFFANCTCVKKGFWQLQSEHSSEALDPFCSWEGVTLHERAKLELTTAHYETKVYERIVKKALVGIPDGIALELGAGDGRITHMLLENWTGYIVACDCNRPALERLYASFTPQDHQRIVILCGDIKTILLSKVKFSLIIAFETLYYLNKDFEFFLSKLANSLDPLGKLIHAEPTVEGWLLLCLAIEDWDGAILAAQKNLVESGYNGYTLDEMKNIYTKCGLKLLATDTTSLANLLLINRLVRSNLTEEQRIETARKIRGSLERFSIPRCIVYTASRS